MNKVLVIEPDKILIENLVEILELEGFNVRAATTLFEAKSAMNAFNPSIIICDEYSLTEEFTGLSIELKKAHKHSSILMMNADGTNENYKDADIYLQMPFHDKELISKLATLKTIGRV
jgi:DNA-binding NtrC family response regulator